MGWDPSVIPVCGKDGTRSYTFLMATGASYTTQYTLQDYGADVLVGRGARVYAVTKDGGDQHTLFALKDMWPEDDRMTEKEIHRRVIEDIIRVNKMEKVPMSEEEIKRCFITPDNDYFATIDGKEDHTKHTMMRQRLNLKRHIVNFAKLFNPNSQSVALPMSSDGGFRQVSDGASSLIDTKAHEISHRRHYRIVFKDFGKPLYKLTNMSQSFLVVRDGTKGSDASLTGQYICLLLNLQVLNSCIRLAGVIETSVLEISITIRVMVKLGA